MSTTTPLDLIVEGFDVKAIKCWRQFITMIEDCLPHLKLKVAALNGKKHTSPSGPTAEFYTPTLPYDADITQYAPLLARDKRLPEETIGAAGSAQWLAYMLDVLSNVLPPSTERRTRQRNQRIVRLEIALTVLQGRVVTRKVSRKSRSRHRSAV